MNKKSIYFINLFAAFFVLASAAQAQTKITVDVNKPGHEISPTLFGIFFEDINLSADGGLYPEMVKIVRSRMLIHQRTGNSLALMKKVQLRLAMQIFTPNRQFLL